MVTGSPELSCLSVSRLYFFGSDPLSSSFPNLVSFTGLILLETFRRDP